jgi:ABC-type transport system involved in cytochrome bd biosynthesis fused ATPase/permease subunit
MEKFLLNYKESQPNLGLIMYPESFMIGFEKKSEIRLIGKSGAGKTTYLRNLVINASYKYALGEFLYLDQKMKLPKSTDSILSIMGELVKYSIDIDLLCKYSEILGIENIINRETIYESFLIQPSGGEEKRILILRAIIGILMGKCRCRLIFNDEITAGLDEESWSKVRQVIDILKRDFRVFFITIDHHNITDVVEYLVCKEIVDVDVDLNSDEYPPLKSSYLINMYTILDETPKKKKTKVLTWIPEIDEHPF